MLHHFSNVYIFKTFYVKQSYLIYHHRPKKTRQNKQQLQSPRKQYIIPFFPSSCWNAASECRTNTRLRVLTVIEWPLVTPWSDNFCKTSKRGWRFLIQRLLFYYYFYYYEYRISSSSNSIITNLTFSEHETFNMCFVRLGNGCIRIHQQGDTSCARGRDGIISCVRALQSLQGYRGEMYVWTLLLSFVEWNTPADV